MTATVIYHSADFDGIFCREIARKFLPDAELIGWNFGDAKIPNPVDDRQWYVLDLSPECFESALLKERVIWIDHHKTSIDKWPKDIPGYRIDGVAACRLAWQWFTMVDGNTPRVGAEIGIPIRPADVLPMIQDYKNREVDEPLAVRLAGEYDIWDKRDPDAELFQHGLRSCDLDGRWERMFGEDDLDAKICVNTLLKNGEVLRYAKNKEDESLVTHKSFRLKWEGLDFLCLNTGRFNSLTFAALDKPETGHDALMGFMWNGKVWTISLYHANHRKDLDLSTIAVKHGGGGHKGACGFTCKQLPFL